MTPDDAVPGRDAGPPAGPPRPATVVLAPDRRLAALHTLAGAAGLVGVVVAAGLHDPQAAVLLTAAAVALLGLGGSELAVRPRLVAGPDGVEVRSATGGRRGFTWNQLEAVRADRRARFGRRVDTLELDAGEDLVVLGARVLGTDAVSAARRVVAVSPPHRRGALDVGIRPAGRDRRSGPA